MTQYLMKIWQWIIALWPVWMLVILVLSMVMTNFSPDGWLTGWDNLHSEFWIEMNIGRSLSAVWQEYQGLGLLGGMGHAADLFRELILWLVGLIVPVEWLRYGYHMAMYLTGMIGVYVLTKHELDELKLENVSKVGALLGALYYGLNLGSILYFYAPFEPYSTFWGMLPWEIYVLIKYLKTPSRKNLIWLAAINLLSVAQGYVQTLFIVYGICFAIIIVVNLLRSKTIQSLKHGLLAGFIVLLINSFWVLPSAYYVLHAVDDHNNSSQISFSTEMFYLMNKGRGTLEDFAQMKLFYADFTDWKTDGSGFDYFAPAWVSHYENKTVAYTSYGLMAIALIGLLTRFNRRVEFSGILLLGVVAFLSNEYGFSQLNDLMRKNELFAQLFRNPYTKLIVPTVMVIAVLFGIGIAKLIALTIKYISRYVGGLIVVAVICGLGLISSPIWKGEFFYKAESIDIPTPYFELFEYMKTNADVSGRVALLPAHYMWGWNNHSWGYRGSGFLWYGIKQPILDRAFDVWSSYNETFYSELSLALYGNNSGDIHRVAEKYNVKYLLLDKSVTDVGLSKDYFRYEETELILDRMKYVRTFENDFITVWDTGIATNQFVSAPSTYSSLAGNMVKTREDVIYSEFGSYIQSSDPVASFPFASLMKEESKNVEYQNDNVAITADIERKDQQQTIIVPAWKVGEIVRIDFKDNIPLPAYKINGEVGPVFLGKEKPDVGKNYIVAKVSEAKEWSEYLVDKEYSLLGTVLSIEVESAPDIFSFGEGSGEIRNCDVLSRGSVGSVGSTYYADERGSVCDYVALQEQDTRLGYLLRIRGENTLGRSVKIYLYNSGSKRNDIEYLLNKDRFDQTFNLLPWAFDGFYTLNIDVRSFGQKTQNTIEQVEVHYLPIDKIARMKIVNNDTSLAPTENKLVVKRVQKFGTWLYIVETENAGLLRLSQGYDEGWISPWVEHVKVDGWANGWMVPGSVTIAIFYWPQLLEYLGFLLLGVTVIVLLARRR